MGDGIAVTPGQGTTVAADDLTSGTYNTQKAEIVKLGLGAAHAMEQVSAANPLPVTGTVTVSQPGLSGGILQSVTTVGASAVLLPATPLAGRATMLVQSVKTNTASIWIGKSTVTADYAATGGIELLPGQSVPIALAAGVLLYAISTAVGQKVATLEVAA